MPKTEESGGMSANGNEVSFGGDKSVLELVVIDAQLCVYTKNMWIWAYENMWIKYVNIHKSELYGM